jgi:hypothetical protein
MVKTIKLQGRDYAQVAERIKEFRSDCPNGLIETSYTFLEDKQIVFKTRVLKDKANSNSAEATGTALGSLKKEKDFEKLETISVGRALALLGYMASGEVASSEEMEEYLAYKDEKKAEMIAELKAQVDEITDIAVLREFYVKNKGHGAEFDAYVMAKSNALKNGN